MTDWLHAGVAFGADVTERFLKANGLELLIRCVRVCVALSVCACALRCVWEHVCRRMYVRFVLR